MQKVFIVYFDNGADYPEDRDYHIEKIFSTLEKAEQYAKERTDASMEEDDVLWSYFTPSWSVVEQEVL